MNIHIIIIIIFNPYMPHYYFLLLYSSSDLLDHSSIKDLTFFGSSFFFMIYGLTSFIFIFIAQLSHIQHECIQINTRLKNDFLYNQVSSAVNYKTDNPLIRFICFGLDIQIEHHLFPNIPHSSLRQIQHIVRDYCNKNDVPYVEYPSIYPTIINYVKYLYNMRNP